MNSEGPGRDALAAALLLGVLMTGVIVFGSLYPFQFRPLPDGTTMTDAVLQALHRRPGGRGDLVANLVLYAPLGLALALVLQARFRPAVAATVAALACLLLSAAMEFGQIHVPRRSPSGLDLLLNAVGGGAGALVAIWVRPPASGLPGAWLRPVEPFAALLLGCWLAYRLFPYVPALDWGEWRASLAPLRHLAGIDPWRVLRLAVFWLAAARLLAAAWPRLGGTLPFAALILAVLAAAVPIVDRRVNPAEVAAAGLALAAWPVLRRLRHGDLLLAGLMLAAVLAESLSPFILAAEPRPFGWVPFRSVVRGNLANGLQAVLLKTFLYGTLLWLAIRSGLRAWLAVPAVVGLAFGIALFRTWIPWRTADSTDPALAAIAALLLVLFARLRRRADLTGSG
ncbi:VanZ family protein [Falsiroseomonas bella]|uniref:VanZ family protein n=1 Tax=Falsiroseomonas bella TaxID=2184016 RepID=UPI0013049A9A|nr:VanZ family protein [Falsiroseomonas bella]